jgi:hypothetical protein
MLHRSWRGGLEILRLWKELGVDRIFFFFFLDRFSPPWRWGIIGFLAHPSLQEKGTPNLVRYVPLRPRTCPDIVMTSRQEGRELSV